MRLSRRCRSRHPHRRRPAPLAAVLVGSLALVGAACSGSDAPEATATTRSSAATVDEVPLVTSSARPAGLPVPWCDDVPDPADSLDWAGAQRTDFPNPLVTREALLVAFAFPYTVDVWGATGVHEGWFVIGVSGGAVELQAELDATYPGARVIVMPIDWTPFDLSNLAIEVQDATAGLQPPPEITPSTSRGQVRVDLGTVTPERLAPLTSFADRRVCVTGTVGN